MRDGDLLPRFKPPHHNATGVGGIIMQRCKYANPCRLTIGPDYSDWNVVELDAASGSLNSTTMISVDVANGFADLWIGPNGGEAWQACCGPKGLDDCSYNHTDTLEYNGTCAAPDTHGTLYLSMWNHNRIEDEFFTITFNDGEGDGPA